VIYTIGYQCLTPTRLREVVLGLGAVLIDCRERPISRKPGFGFRQLQVLLPTDNYALAGHLLGGRGNVKQAGIDRLEQVYYRSKSKHCVLMCMEHHPADCHRHTDITGVHFPRALHIMDDMIHESGDLQAAIEGKRSYESIGAQTLEA
jgi:uncharacterized protein (DUF488 family)